MNEIDGEFYSSDQSPTTPAVIPAKDSNVRPHGDMLKMMNPTPNGYSSVPNHKPKSEGQEVKKHHESKNNIDHHKHSSDHVKKKEDDSSKHKSSHSKPKEYSKEGKSENQSGHPDKEKKHSSHSDSSKSKDSSSKHSEHSKHSSSAKKEDKHKSDSVKKEHHSSEGKPKTDNFKENEKIKDSSSKEKSREHKEKHKDKHRDKEHKDKHKDKEHREKHKDKSSSDKLKEKSDKPKDKGDKSKDESHEKHKDKHSEKSKDREHGEKSKDKEHSEKHKNKEHKDKEHGEKHKDKDHSEKHKDKEHSEKHKEKEHGEKHKEKHKDKHNEKQKEKNKEEKLKVIKSEPENESSPGRLIIKDEISVKDEPMSEEDIPLSARQASILANMSMKREPDSDDEPLSSKAKKGKSEKKKKKPTSDDDEYYEVEQKPKKRKKAASDDDDYETKKPTKKVKKEKAKIKKEIKEEPIVTASPKKRGKKEEDEQEVWKWWEEEKLEDGIKWKTLEHYGPVFAPPYERVPKNVKFYYDGKHMELSELTEEVAGFYGRMLDHEYTSKDVFNTNFFKDWRKVMTPAEKEKITDLKKCNFNDFNVYYKQKSEERKAMTKEEKLVIKKENEELTKKYGFCIIDGHKQKIGNFKIEPPGLFRGRGEHPKMGMLKRRIEAEDILINIGKEAKTPEAPPGHKWKEVRHDNTVSWLASWTENILGSTKYIMLNPSSKLKGEKDWQKYETARKLKAHADRIREEYTRDFKSKEMKVRQRAVALYFIDKLALRAGNEKDEDTADTVGCCSLRVEHITLHDELDGKEYVVDFDFLGKDSIRYNNSVPVEKRAYKNLKLFMENKQPGDDLFDRLNTSILNKYLNDLMEGLTAKVFRTYNASKTLQEQLELLTKAEMSIPEKILAYNRANRAVAILCNHQRAVPKGFSKAMENLKTKMDEKESQIKEFKKELKAAKSAAKDGGSKEKVLYDKKKKRLASLEEQLKKLEVQATDKEENKQIALGTSKLNYLDPRISVAWCKKWGVPIEKIYNRTQRDKFRWAIEMAGPDYKF